MAFGYFMNINAPSRQIYTLRNKLAKKVQPQLGLKLDNAQYLQTCVYLDANSLVR